MYHPKSFKKCSVTYKILQTFNVFQPGDVSITRVRKHEHLVVIIPGTFQKSCHGMIARFIIVFFLYRRTNSERICCHFMNRFMANLTRLSRIYVSNLQSLYNRKKITSRTHRAVLNVYQSAISNLTIVSIQHIYYVSRFVYFFSKLAIFSGKRSISIEVFG